MLQHRISGKVLDSSGALTERAERKFHLWNRAEALIHISTWPPSEQRQYNLVEPTASEFLSFAGRKGGSSKTPAKAKASKRNGKKHVAKDSE